MEPSHPKSLDCTLDILAKALNRKPALWVGAGMSVAAGFPTAWDLVEAMREDALEELPMDRPYDEIADAYVASESEGSLFALLSRLFPSNTPPTSWHHSAARLYKTGCFASVVTTNYDCLLEHAFTEGGCDFVVQTLDRNQELAQPNRIMKIHGGTDDYKSLVLSRKSYGKYARKYKFLKNQLNQIFIQQPILFVGCSMTDPRILNWLQQAKAKQLRGLKSWFALMTDSQVETLKKATYGKDQVVDILAKAQFRVLKVRDFDHAPELFEQLCPLMEAEPPSPIPSQKRPLKNRVPSTPQMTEVEAPLLFVGRKKEQEKLVAGLAEPGSVQVIYQLVGSGGVGKTALANQVAAACRDKFDRVLSFYMAEHTPQSFAVALALELGVEKPVEPGDERAARREISRLLGQGRFLLILDNIATPEDVSDLLPQGGQTRVLITTRERAVAQVLHESRADLKVEPIELGLFNAEENLDLFRRVLRDFDEEEAPVYHKIGESLGFLPVALRLALNWMAYPPHWSATELFDQLQQEKLKVLAQVKGKSRDENLKNLQTVYQLDKSMSGPQSRVLRHLAVCAEGPVPFSFLVKFHKGNADTLRENLEELYSRSWCQRSQGEEPAFELHVLVRELVLEQETIPQMEERFLAVVHEIYDNKSVQFSLKDRWIPQVREALNKWWKKCRKKPDPRLVSLIYDPFHSFCRQRGHGKLFVDLVDLVLAKGQQYKGLWSDVLLCKGVVLVGWGRSKEAFELFQEAQVLYEASGNLKSLAVCFGNQASILNAWGRLEEAYALHQKEEGIQKDLSDRAGLSVCYGNQAIILKAWGRLDEAYALHQKQEGIRKDLGDRAGLANCYGNQALILAIWGKLEEAYALHQKEEGICKDLGDRVGLSGCYGNQATILFVWGRLEEAYELHEKEERICEALGDRAGLAICYVNQAVILKAKGQLDDAMALFVQAEAIFSELNASASLAQSLDALGGFYCDLGNPKKGLEYHQRASALCRKVGDQEILAANFDYRALAHLEQGELSKAATLASQAQEIWEKIGNLKGLAPCLSNQAVLLAYQGDFKGAREKAARAQDLWKPMDEKFKSSGCLWNQGALAVMSGDDDQAEAFWQQALAAYKSMELPVETWEQWKIQWSHEKNRDNLLKTFPFVKHRWL